MRHDNHRRWRAASLRAVSASLASAIAILASSSCGSLQNAGADGGVSSADDSSSGTTGVYEGGSGTTDGAGDATSAMAMAMAMANDADDETVLDPPPASPTAYVTTDNLSMALAATPILMGDQPGANAVVAIDTSTTYQSIVGFGASITDSSSYVMTKDLSTAALQDVLEKLFDPTAGVGLNVLRQPMGASDFSSVGNFSYDDGTSDPRLANFSISQDLKATIPILRRVLAINKGVTIIGSPWSPPAWMKVNGSMDGTGGAPGDAGLISVDYEPYGQYFVKFVQAYAAAGIPVSAVTPQNEPNNGAAAYPAMGLNPSSETQLIGGSIGPAFSSAGLKTSIWAYDHNWDDESYAAQVIGDTTAGTYIEGAAFHCYYGDPSAMTTFHEAFPTKSVYMTECSGGSWQSDPFAAVIDLAIQSTANWARAVVLWNVALDEHAGPQNDGCNNCRGLITVNSQSGNVTYNADYFALGHFSKFVRKRALRIASTSSNSAISQVAFLNPNGSVAVVAHNTGGSMIKMQVGAGAAALSVQVPGNAAVTVYWTP